jgi:hypothetical protein
MQEEQQIGSTKIEEKRKALIISISDYLNELAPLDFCKDDGEKMYETLKSLGYEIPDSNRLIGEIRYDQVRPAISRFFTDKSVKPKDTLIFYFSGHGIPDGTGEHYLATSDIDPDAPWDNGFSFEDLTKMMDRSNSRRVIVILDCCYSGSARLEGKGAKGDESAARLGREAIEQTIKNRIPAGEGRCILASSLAYQESFQMKKLENSLFTYYLLEGLRGGGGESVDDEGNVTPESLSNYVFEKITSLDPPPKQKPIKKLETAGLIILAQHPDLVKKSLQQQLSIGISSTEWKILSNQIKDRNCVPFIGDGVSIAFLPHKKEIANRWTKEYNYPFEDSSMLEAVAQFLAIAYGNEGPKNLLSDELKKINSPDFIRAEYSNTPPAVLADLNLPIYITTNYDHFIENALYAKGRQPISDFCRWNQDLKEYANENEINLELYDINSGYKATSANPLVYHLHGDIDHPSSMVLTEADYHDFVKNLNIESDRLLPSVIRKSLASKLSLFIGYDLSDISFRVICQSAILRGIRNIRGIMTLLPPTKAKGENIARLQSRYLEAYLNKVYKIRIYWGSAESFCNELRKLLYDNDDQINHRLDL